MQLIDLPLTDIATNALLRDRSGLDPEPLVELEHSILMQGLRQPIEVFATPGAEQPYGLISGLRRLTACQSLGHATIPALICTPKDMAAAMAAMVAENEIRAPISPWEKAALLYATLRNDVFPNADAAIKGLYPALARQRRAQLRGYVAVYESFEDLFTTPEALSAQRMDRLAAALRGDLEEVMQQILLENRDRSLETQWHALAPAITEALRDPTTDPAAESPSSTRPRRSLTLKQGLTIRRELTRTGYILRFSGPEARSGGLIDDVFDMVERWFQKA
jgi:ParB family transcriptional regulator, chromosome partitioning protein